MKLTKIEPATSDERGNISDILYKVDIQHSAIINTVGGKNVVRGNHYHKETTQWIFITKGYLMYWYIEAGSEEVKFIRVNENELVESPPYEKHALHILEDNQFIVYSQGKRGGQDYESDTFRVEPFLTKDVDLKIYA
jgi:dTDP-4-dehydrorhamnose 3,5-epimerase-like enzyme